MILSNSLRSTQDVSSQGPVTRLLVPKWVYLGFQKWCPTVIHPKVEALNMGQVIVREF
jgi:hypothetical protein